MNHDVSIVGPGQGTLSVSGDGNSRVFEIASGVAATLSGITIAGGKVNNGGGISNFGSLTINASTISGNSATYGGGFSNFGTLTMDASTVSGNSADNGGGILNFGTLTITASTISGNSALAFGGIYAAGGTLTITGSTISSNSADRDPGGGIFNDSVVTIDSCTISGNSAGYDGGSYNCGGGIYNDMYGTMTITGSTLSGNVTVDGVGGSIYNSGALSIDSSTISGNSAVEGGGIYIWNIPAFSPTVTISTSIVAGNSGSTNPDVTGAFDSLGYNLIGNTDGSSGWTATDLLNLDPKLGPLQDNGGPTMTMALLPGSPAIDAGSNALIPPGVQYDQRGPGFQRIVNGTVDIGAYEFLPVVNDAVAVAGERKPPRS